MHHWVSSSDVVKEYVTSSSKVQGIFFMDPEIQVPLVHHKTLTQRCSATSQMTGILHSLIIATHLFGAL